MYSFQSIFQTQRLLYGIKGLGSTINRLQSLDVVRFTTLLCVNDTRTGLYEVFIFLCKMLTLLPRLKDGGREPLTAHWH